MPKTQKIHRSPSSASLKIRNFQIKDCPIVREANLELAYSKLGAIMARSTQTRLRLCLSSIDKVTKNELLEEARVSLLSFERLAKDGILTTKDDVNRLKRFLLAFDSYTRGAKITREQAAFMHMELESGCQTLVVQNRSSSEIAMIHAEEDKNWSACEGYETYPYKWVTTQIGGSKVSFFAYPGLFWGPAFSLNESTGLIQAVDTISPNGPHGKGKLWANAIVFMFLDCGTIDRVIDLIEKIQLVPSPLFHRGYAVQIIQKGSPPQVLCIEFGGDTITRAVPRIRFGNRLVLGHGNAPINGKLQEIDEINVTTGRYWKKLSRARDRKMEERIRRRLELLGALVGNAHGEADNWWGEGNALSIGLKVLANPYGDARRFSNGYLITALPSKLVTAYAAVYASPNGRIASIVGKRTPPPLPGKEYSFKPSKYSRVHINTIVQKP